MKTNNSDKETYNSVVCKYCSNRNQCDKNKFKVYVVGNKVTMRCTDYSYDNV